MEIKILFLLLLWLSQFFPHCPPLPSPLPSTLHSHSRSSHQCLWVIYTCSLTSPFPSVPPSHTFFYSYMTICRVLFWQHEYSINIQLSSTFHPMPRPIYSLCTLPYRQDPCGIKGMTAYKNYQYSVYMPLLNHLNHRKTCSGPQTSAKAEQWARH